jgi:hypothetical protein
VKILIKAYIDSLKNLPLMLRKRRAIQEKRTVSTGKLFRLMKQYGIRTKDIALKS